MTTETNRKAKRTKESQMKELAEVWSRIEAERATALAEEPWSSFVTDSVPMVTGDMVIGVMPTPSSSGAALFGARLAFELAGYCADADQVLERINDYFSEIKNHDHLYEVAFSALATIASYVVPILLDVAEHEAGDYDLRIAFAHLARGAWIVRDGGLDSDARLIEIATAAKIDGRAPDQPGGAET